MRTSFTFSTFSALLLLGSCYVLSSCGSVRGKGDAVERTINVAEFHGIVVVGSIDVLLTQGQKRSVVVEAQPNIADLLMTEVRKGTWTISTSASYSTSKAFIVHITAPLIDGVRVQGSGDVKGEGAFVADDVRVGVEGSGDVQMTFIAKRIEVSVGGSGDIELAGECEKLKAFVTGSGDVKAQELMARDADAEVTGSGDITVHATGVVNAAVIGSGDVSVYGSPTELNKEEVGSGSVRRMK